MMSVRKVFILFVVALCVGVAATAALTPVFEYAFPDSYNGTSTAIVDLSSAGNDGTMDSTGGYLNGDVPPGGAGGSLTGASGGHGRTNAVDLLENSIVAAHGGYTMDVWFYWPGNYTDIRKLLDYAGTEALRTFEGQIQFIFSNNAYIVGVPIESQQWYHVVAEFDAMGNAVAGDGSLAGEARLWLDDLSGTGLTLAASAPVVKTAFGDSLNRPIGINRWAGGGGDWNQGKIYNPAVYLGVIHRQSWDPTPGNGLPLISIDTGLSWAAPDVYDVVAYDVYFDPNESKVASADPSVRIAERQAETFMEFDGPLAYNTTYFWRVDAYEPNAPGPDILHPGVVWSFTTEPETPVVEVGPREQIVPTGQDAMFTVVGRNQTLYEWFLSPDPLVSEDDTLLAAGADLNTLVVPNVTTDLEGYVYCVLSNAVGEDVSAPVLLMTQRLVAQWEFEESLADSVGAHDGQPFGEPNYVPDSFAGGMAIDLDGQSAVTVPWSPELNTESFTVTAWANVSGGVGAYRALVSGRHDNPTQGYIIYAANNNKWQFWTPGVAGSWSGMSTADPVNDVHLDEWVFIAVTFEAQERLDDGRGTLLGRRRLYINGAVAVEQTGAAYRANRFRDLLIGAGANENPLHDFFFQGQIDDVRFYNYAVDAFAVAEEYVRLVPEASICVRYPALQFDVTGPEGVPDCQVDLLDLAEMAGEWLLSHLVEADH